MLRNRSVLRVEGFAESWAEAGSGHQTVADDAFPLDMFRGTRRLCSFVDIDLILYSQSPIEFSLHVVQKASLASVPSPISSFARQTPPVGRFISHNYPGRRSMHLSTC